MKTIFLVLALLFSLGVQAEGTSAPLASPKLSHVWAKIQLTETAGSQLFVSYDKGQSFEQASWPAMDEKSGRYYGQATEIAWSENGLLLVQYLNTDASKAIKQIPGQISDLDKTSVGIFDPAAKIIYWFDGPMATNEYSDNNASGARWISAQTLFYKRIWMTARYFEETDKYIKITPEFLAKIKKPDLSPKVLHFGRELQLAAAGKVDVRILLAQISVKTRQQASLFIQQNTECLARQSIISTLYRHPKNNYTITIENNFKAEEIKKGVFMPGIELFYDSTKKVYEFELISYD